MPPSSDFQCQKSSDFHFVNDYLYKPINSKQAAAYNTSLKYADRFFPEGFGGENGNREVVGGHASGGGGGQGGKYFASSEEGEEEEEYRRPQQQQQPQQQFQSPRQPHPQQAHPPRQQPHPHPHPQSYYTSPSEINIPLTSRRPIPSNKLNSFRPSPQIVNKAKEFY